MDLAAAAMVDLVTTRPPEPDPPRVVPLTAGEGRLDVGGRGGLAGQFGDDGGGDVFGDAGDIGHGRVASLADLDLGRGDPLGHLGVFNSAAGSRVGGGAVGALSNAQIVEWMVGRAVTELYPRSPRTPGAAVLEISGVAGRRLPESASLVLHRGEVLGIAGLVGAGRTELVRAVFGLDPVRRGTVRVAAETGTAAPARRWAQGVGMVSEDRKAEGMMKPGLHAKILC
jgi:hypothetical protein